MKSSSDLVRAVTMVRSASSPPVAGPAAVVTEHRHATARRMTPDVYVVELLGLVSDPKVRETTELLLLELHRSIRQSSSCSQPSPNQPAISSAMSVWSPSRSASAATPAPRRSQIRTCRSSASSAARPGSSSGTLQIRISATATQRAASDLAGRGTPRQRGYVEIGGVLRLRRSRVAAPHARSALVHRTGCTLGLRI